MIVMAGRIVWDSSLARLPLSLEWGDYWAFVLGVTFVPALAFLVRVDESSLQLAYRWSRRFGMVTALMIVAAAVVGLTDLSALRRLATSVLNPITIGHVGVSLFALLALDPVAPEVRQESGLWKKIAKFLGLGFASILVIASASKGPALAWVAVIGVWLVVSVRASATTGAGFRESRRHWHLLRSSAQLRCS